MSYRSFYRYIYEKKNRYVIRKGDEEFGRFTRLADALYERDRLMAVDWDWDKLSEMPETPNNYLHIKLPPFNHKGQYITHDKEHWVVRGYGRRQRHYGTYFSKEEAELVAKIYYANVAHRNEAYRVQKRVNGKTTYFGRYKTREEAEERVRELEENGWKK